MKQGTVESPAIFAKVVEWVFLDAKHKGGWTDDTGCFSGLEVLAIAFMDDGIMWQQGTETLQQRMEYVVAEMEKWGLPVNLAKCQLYKSPHAEGRAVVVQGVEVLILDHLAKANGFGCFSASQLPYPLIRPTCIHNTTTKSTLGGLG